MKNNSFKYFAFILVLLFLLQGCSNRKDFIDTGVNIKSGKFCVLNEKFSYLTKNNKSEIVKSSNLKTFFSFENECNVLDVKSNIVLFSDKDGYFTFDLDRKKEFRFDKEIIPLSDDFCDTECKLTKDGKSVVVKKVIYNKEKPFCAGKTVLGYFLNQNTGVYIYSSNKGNEEAKYLLEQFKIKDNVNIDIETLMCDNDGIGIVVRTSMMGTSFFDEYYYSVNNSEKELNYIGNYLISENLDADMDTFKFCNYYVSMNTDTVLVVDFLNKNVLKTKCNDKSQKESIFIEENGKFFVVKYQSNVNNLRKYEILSNKIYDTIISDKEFSDCSYCINDFLSGCAVQLSQNQIEKFNDYNIKNDVFKTFSNECYVVKTDENYGILYK